MFAIISVLYTPTDPVESLFEADAAVRIHPGCEEAGWGAGTRIE